MDYRKLNEEVTDVVIEALQHFDYVDREGPPQTLEETQASFFGAVYRYRNDPILEPRHRCLSQEL